MEETAPQSAPAPSSKLTKEQRSKIMKEAATRRWAKAKRAKTAQKTMKASSKGSPSKKKSTAPREFSSALKTAEKRLAKAIQERAEAGAKYAILTAEIPSLQRLIMALKNPLGAVPDPGILLGPSLEQIVSDQPIAYQNPPRGVPAGPPVIPVPQALHPANQQSRAMGGAVGLPLDEDEDENKYLAESPIAGGQWHG